ncbi:uncharacterized protein LOC119455002 [Dermacentor silvarum]|uniref:uncharacterized protein LOC119455002 n=1 Tax=Dermacentor silvarum TaxID=543639 RepID=UPI00210090C2|nr:uncharacterized protein LOC119455002 [Dermacentor silvarum]
MSFKNSLSTGHHCVVYGCSYNQKKRNAARKELCGTHNVLQEVCGCNVYLLHRFPADADLKRQWVAAVNRKDFVPSPSSRLCSAHFVDGKRTDLNPVPMLRLGYERKVLKGRRRVVKHDGPQLKKKRTAENVAPASPLGIHNLDTGKADFPKDACQEKDDTSSEGLRLLCAAASMKVCTRKVVSEGYFRASCERAAAANEPTYGLASKCRISPQHRTMPVEAHAAPSEEQDSGSEQQGFHDRSGECQKQHMPAQAHAAPSEEQGSGSEQQGFHDRSGECQKQHMPAQAHAAPSEEQDSGSEQQGFHDRSGECQKQHVGVNAS